MSDRVAARLRIERAFPNSAGRIASDTTPGVPMWMNADGVRLTLTTADGAVIMDGTLETIALKGWLAPDGEVLRFHFQPTEYPGDDPA